MQLGAPKAGQAVGERAPHELVGKAVAESRTRDLLDRPGTHGLVESSVELVIAEPSRFAQHSQLELGAGDGSTLE